MSARWKPSRGESSRWHPDEQRIDSMDVGQKTARVNSSSLFARLTGTSRDVDVSGTGDNITGMLMAVGGESKRSSSGINITAAARKLGVHPTTVRRWIKGAQGEVGGSKPRGDHLKSLRRKSKQTTSTKAGRAQVAAAARARYAGQHLKLQITGRQGIAAGGASYLRHTTTEQDLDPEQFERLINAYEAGGDKAVAAEITRIWQGDDTRYGYHEDWGFESMDRFDFR